MFIRRLCKLCGFTLVELLVVIATSGVFCSERTDGAAAREGRCVPLSLQQTNDTINGASSFNIFSIDNAL